MQIAYSLQTIVTNSVAAENPQNLALQLTDTFNEVKAYCSESDLKINTSKTQFIVFKSITKKLPSDLELVLDGVTIIKPVSSVKLLGTVLDQHLTMGPCIDEIVKKCSGLLGMLRKASPYLSRELLRLAYISLIRPHLEFASIILAPAAITHLRKLDVIQKIASRIICSAPSQAHSAPLQLELGLASLDSRRTDHITKFIDSILRGSCHPVFSDYFSVLDDGSITSSMIAPRTKLGSKRFRVFGSKVDNDRNCSVTSLTQ